ncbi:MAG: hypothetical protein FJ405_19050, partial [Verrucomicrobia bacterium]|nr:hypothetical protein [Verrucomicrobiota bacterium]
RLTGYHHGWEFGGSEPGITFGRHLDVGQRASYIALQSPTPGAANSGPRESQVIISEIHYHPAPAVGPDFNREIVEVANLSDAAVALFDPAAGTNVFRLRGDVDFEFPTGIVLAGRERVVVVGFDPSNVAQAAAFRAEFGAPPGLRIFGPFRGNLSNDRGRVRLQSPAPVSALVPQAVHYVVSEVEHHADHPSLTTADGYGASLHRSSLTGPDNVPPLMREGLPSPGSPSGSEPPPDILHQPAQAYVLEGRPARLQPTLAPHGARVRYQWTLNGEVVPWAQGPVLELSSVRLTDAGAYQLVIVTEGGSSWTQPASLVVLLPAFFVEQPQGRSVLAGTNITLRAQAIGTGDFTYQWRKNGVALPGRNSESLSLIGATPADTGVYDVLFTDARETIVSQPAPVTVSIRPAFIVPPQPLTVVQGDNAVFFATVSGTPPLTFRWNRSGRLVTNMTIFENTGVLIFRNVQPTNSGPITLTVTNLGGATAQSLAVSLTVLADADRDGQGDLWEGANGLNVNDSADGGLDMDGDRMLNRDEFSAGTNPRDPGSLLKLIATAVEQGTLLQFQAMSNRAYTVQYRTTLSGDTWQKLTDVLWRSTNRIADVIHTNTLMDPSFYRVITPSDPGLERP